MVIVCFSHLRWNFVYQRPQHIMSRMAKHFRVFFVEEPFFDTDKAYLHSKEEKQNLWVIVPHLPPGLNEDKTGELIDELVEGLLAIHEQKGIIAWYYTPMAFRPERVIEADLVIY